MKRRVSLIHLVALPLLVPLGNALLGCRERSGTAATTTAPATNDANTVAMTIGKETFHLEVADTPAEQERGLMAHDSMPPDHGMIFLFVGEQERHFWMKDTLIPLDIVYVEASGRVISVKSMKPRDLSDVSSDGPAKYAIELNHGAADRAGVRPGDVLTIPSEALSRHGSE